MCRRVVWVDDGLYRMDGPAEQVVTAFQGHEARRMTERWKTGKRIGPRQPSHNRSVSKYSEARVYLNQPSQVMI
jgi:hypothetical protein